MFSEVLSCAVSGIDGLLIHVEADVSEGLPMFNMVGFLASEVREANERVRTALRNAGFILPPKKITVNLSPANIRKEGSSFDLPIAITILSAMGYIPQEYLNNIVIIGELSLDGHINSVNGVLPIVHYCKNQGIDRFIVPYSNRLEGGIIDEVDVIGCKTLSEVVDYLNDNRSLEPIKVDVENIFKQKETFEYDFSLIKGQWTMRRAMEIAAAGRHNVLIMGSAGSGKSLAAKCLPSIMPDLTFEEAIDITKIYSVSGMLDESKGLILKRPFRAPHHTISEKALIGGGTHPRPGEISLAHNGVLFLDEFLEFNKNVIEVLRQPLEDKKVTISRIHGSYTYPTDTMLVAAMNPCPCGNYPDFSRCSCTRPQIKRYLNKVSKAILDRIDVSVMVMPVKYDELYSENSGESSGDIRKRIIDAVDIQKHRYMDTGKLYNSQMTNEDIQLYCHISKKDKELFKKAFDRLGLSARAGERILKVARTIADLEGSKDIQSIHLQEAIGYRIDEKEFLGGQ